MKKKLLLALTLGSAALAGTPSFAFAQAAPPPAAAPHERMRDRTVTREEALARADRMFDAIDTDHDGKITPDVRKAAHEKMRERWQARRAEQTAPGADASAAPNHKWGDGHRGGHHMGMRGMRGDPNRVITREDFRQKAIERFDRMDLNHDGKITPDERKAARAQMREKFRERMQMRRDRGDAPAPSTQDQSTPSPRP